jgi:MFS family permease
VSWRLLLVALVAAELVCSLESNMVYVALAEVYRESGNPVHAGWLITAFTLTAAAAAAVCSRLGDMYGRKRVLLVMLGVAFMGSLISAVGSSLDMVIVGRALQGASMVVLPLCYGLLRENAPVERIPMGVAILGGTYSLGGGIGTMLGGFIVDHFHWQGIFLASAALAVVAIFLVAYVLPPSKIYPGNGSLDLLGGVMFAPAIATVLLGLTFLRSFEWHEWQVLGLLVGGGLVLAVWARHELRIANPLINVRLLVERRILLANLGMFFFATGPILLPLATVVLMQQPSWPGAGFGLTAAATGTIWLLLGLFSSAGVFLSGLIATRWGTRTAVLGALVQLAVGYVVLAAGGYSSLWVVLLVSAVCLNPGASIAYAMIPSIIIEASPEERTSEATGLTQVIRSVGMAIASLLMPYLLTLGLVSNDAGERLPGPLGYIALFIWLTFTTIVAATCIARLPKSHP